MTSTPARLARNPRALWRATVEGALVLGPDAAEVRFLQGAAGELWYLLAEPAAPTDAFAELALRFGVPLEQVTSELEPVVARLVDEHLLVQAE